MNISTATSEIKNIAKSEFKALLEQGRFQLATGRKSGLKVGGD
jgi:hypothetical protein